MEKFSKPPTCSTLLVPRRLISDFMEKTKKQSIEEYFSILIEKYCELALSGLHPESAKLKTDYQDENQDLVKVNFRPDTQDWIELGIIACQLGISRTALFTWFLTLDIAGWDIILKEKLYFAGVPAKISPILQFTQFSSLRRMFLKRKIYYKTRERIKKVRSDPKKC